MLEEEEENQDQNQGQSQDQDQNQIHDQSQSQGHDQEQEQDETENEEKKQHKEDRPEKEQKNNQTDKKLCPCTLVRTGNVNSMENKDGWTKIKFMVDSGANDTVIPPEELPEVPIQESKGSKLGWSYRVANGAEVPNEGEKQFQGITKCQAGWSKKMKAVTAQVADITQPLMAVKKMTKAGYQVIFDEEGSGALNKVTKEWIPMSEEEDAWFLDMWVKSEDQKTGSGKGFPWQE